MIFKHLLPILTILLPLIVGFGVKLPKPVLRILDKVLTGLVYVILLLIGMDLAKTAQLGSELGKILAYAVMLFGLLLLCNSAVLMWYDRTFFRQHPFVPKHAQRSKISFMGGVQQLLVLIMGLLIGKMLPESQLPPSQAGLIALMALIFIVGMQLRGNGISLWQVMLNRHGLRLSVLFVLSCAMAGVLFAVLIPDVSWSKGVALSSGYGWYSLSGMMITQTYGAVWGSIALLNDLLRELSALILIPVLMRRFPNTAIASGGATSLDFVLPNIQKAGGMAAVPVAISFGFIANLVSPVMMVVMSAIR